MAKHLEAILYIEDGWTKEKIIGIAESKQTIKEYAMILHDKDTDENGVLKKAHFHLYLNFGKSSATTSQVAKWFGVAENHVERIKTKRYYVLKYYLHTNSPEKHQYSVDELICNFDVNAFFKAYENNTSLNQILADCGNGEITPANYQQRIDSITYAKHETEIKRAWSYYDQQLLLKADKKQCNVIWVYGDSGLGKTTICHLYCQQQGLTLYQSASGADPLSNYAGQDAIILDDLRPGVPFSFVELLRILDPHYGSIIHSRYHDKVLHCNTIFITSVLSPMETISMFALHYTESPVQLYRRISEVWNMTQDTIRISTYNLEKHCFREEATVENPVPHYLVELPKSEKIDGASVLRQLLPKTPTEDFQQISIDEILEDDGDELPF